MASSKQEKQWKVYLRLKGVKHMKLFDVDHNILICNVPDKSLFFKNAKRQDKIIRQYTYSKIFEATSSQEDIFNNIVKPKLGDFLNGENTSFVAYGTSGAGKTFTLVGKSSKPGLIPRTLEHLFSIFPNLSKYPRAKSEDNGQCYMLTDRESKKEREEFFNLLLRKFKYLDQYKNTYKKMEKALNKKSNHQLNKNIDDTHSIWVSFAEITNEHVYDLLDCQSTSLINRKELTMCVDYGNVYIENLKYINVTTAFEAFQILQFGLHNLNFLKTPVNRYSNTSHCIFTIKFIQVYPKDQLTVSQIRFCDMVGPDYNKVIRNFGQDLIQSNNNSLVVFTKCLHNIQTLQPKQKDGISYRDSTLTLLFGDVFGGNEEIAIIVNINPICEIFDETLQILNVSALAKTIIVEKLVADIGVATSDNLSEYEETKLTSIIDELFVTLEETTKQNIQLHVNMQQELIQIVRHLEANLKNEQKQTMVPYNTEIEGLQKLVDNLKSFSVTTSESQVIRCVDYDDSDGEQRLVASSQSLTTLVSNVLTMIRKKNELCAVNKDSVSGQNDQLMQLIEEVIELFYIFLLTDTKKWCYGLHSTFNSEDSLS